MRCRRGLGDVALLGNGLAKPLAGLWILGFEVPVSAAVLGYRVDAASLLSGHRRYSPYQCGRNREQWRRKMTFGGILGVKRQTGLRVKKPSARMSVRCRGFFESGRVDSNHRPLRPERSALPG